MAIRAAALSDAGKRRETNEDWFVSEENLGLFAVADGMGGHSAGEVASRLAIEAIQSFIRRSHNDHEFSWPYGIEPTLSYTGNRLRTAVKLANHRVFRAAELHDDYTGMGTTIVSALICGGRVAIAHVGDSRLYRHHVETLTRVTRDDSWMERLGERPDGSPDAKAHYTMRHVLTNVLGAQEETEVHLAEDVLRQGELLLLCTDGLHGAVDDGTIGRILSNEGDVTMLARKLVQQALDSDTRDNVTVLVVRYDEGP